MNKVFIVIISIGLVLFIGSPVRADLIGELQFSISGGVGSGPPIENIINFTWGFNDVIQQSPGIKYSMLSLNALDTSNIGDVYSVNSGSNFEYFRNILTDGELTSQIGATLQLTTIGVSGIRYGEKAFLSPIVIDHTSDFKGIYTIDSIDLVINGLYLNTVKNGELWSGIDYSIKLYGREVPVPEPSTMLLLGSGLLGLVGCGRRRLKK